MRSGKPRSVCALGHTTATVIFFRRNFVVSLSVVIGESRRWQSFKAPGPAVWGNGYVGFCGLEPGDP
jgi:hypothetical protein